MRLVQGHNHHTKLAEDEEQVVMPLSIPSSQKSQRKMGTGLGFVGLGWETAHIGNVNQEQMLHREMFDCSGC